MSKKTTFPLLHVIMFVITFFTTLLAGAMQKGINPIDDFRGIAAGLPFSVTLLCILLTHELSHYFASKVHSVKATLPFFIPAPPPIIFGTFGAFIKMKSPIRSREALVDIGASGPIGGFLVALVATFTGLELSEVVDVSDGAGMLYLGDSVIFKVLSYLTIGNIPDGYDVVLHPIAFAGWIGFFVTSLNLIPIGQLDGGHIAFALLGKRHRQFSIFLIGVLVVLGMFFWPGWLIWAILMIILGIDHPPIISESIVLDRKRRYVSLVCTAIFILSFTPVPFTIEM